MAGFTLKDMYQFSWGNKEVKKAGLKDGQRVRDMLRKGKKGVIHYDVWGNTVATLNPKKQILKVSDAGWRTKLTKDRLNQVLTTNRISQKKGEWFLNTHTGKAIKFRGSAKFKLKRNEVFG